MSYKLQYASNFFLNLHKRRDFKNMCVPSSENLALLGNVCSLDTEESTNTYKNFLNYCSSNFKNVYIVPGPWELSSIKPLHYENCSNNLYRLKDYYKNVKILNNSHVLVPDTDITLVGTSLWVRNPYLKHQSMYEYNHIWLNRRSGLGTVNGNEIKCWHCEDLQFLKDMKKSSQKIVMLTHHLPNHILVKDVVRKPMESSNLEYLMRKPVEVWLGGAGGCSITGSLGVTNDVFCGTNPYTTFDLAKIDVNESYNSEAFISLRKSDIPLL